MVNLEGEKMSEIKKIDIKEFREKGYLQELNRNFLHPLGLALEIVIEEDGTEKLGGIWDYREDKEGMIYDIKNRSEENKEEFRRKKEFVEDEFIKKAKDRRELLGFAIEPIGVGK